MELKRRSFIRVALGVAAQAAVVPTYLLANMCGANVGDAEIADYEAFRQRLICLCKEGYEIKACWLFPPRDGFRHVTVFHSHGSLDFFQPWGETS